MHRARCPHFRGWQNGYAESFHSRVRDELVAGELFADLAEVRVLAAP